MLTTKYRDPETPELDEREHQVEVKLAQASGRTVEDVQRDARRRALRIEVESMRGHGSGGQR